MGIEGPKWDEISVETPKKVPKEVAAEQITAEAQVEKDTVSDEKLWEKDNMDFLEISPSSRLRLLNKEKIASKNVVEGTSLSINFTFDKILNKKLQSRTTAGQIFPANVRELTTEKWSFVRSGLTGEFFHSNGSRLIILQDTKLQVSSYQKDISSLEEMIDNDYEREMKKSQYVWNEDIVKMALEKNIDVSVAFLLCSQLVEGKNEIQRKVIIENALTEFDRVKPAVKNYIQMDKLADGEIKYDDTFLLILMKKLLPNNWKETAKKYDMDADKIQDFASAKNKPYYLNEYEIQSIIAKAPEDLKKYVKKYFPEEEYVNALLVVNFESWFESDAENINTDDHKSTDRGYFQINDHWHHEKYDWEDIYDVEVNVRVASEVFKARQNTWEPWYGAKKAWLWN